MSTEFTFEDLEKIANNPSRVINTIISKVEDAWVNKNISFNSPTHPFVVSLDMITGEAYVLLSRHADATARIYPRHSRNMDDLSRTMSDEEWYGMFANPSTTTMVYMLPVSEINARAVEYTETDGQVVNTYKKLLIPKDTRIKVSSTYFSIENGFEIRQMSHGGHSVVYDSTNVSPFKSISENILKKDYLIINGQKYLRVIVPVRQIECNYKQNIASTKMGGLQDTYSYNDYLYGIRAFIKYANGTKKEMLVTYTSQVFDNTTPTLTIALDSETKTFTYEIPDVYINNELGVGQVSLFVYTTKGAYEQDLKTIAVNEHVPEYLDLDYDNGSLGKYSSPVRDVSNQVWLTVAAVSGGANPRTFASVRKAKIYGSHRESLPVTPNQLAFDVTDRGYSEVKEIDYVTGRIYRLTRELPAQSNKSFLSSMNCYVGSITQSANDLIATGMVFDNSKRVTIPSGVVFDITDTNNRILKKTELSQVLNSGNEAIADYVNNNVLVYNPFYYVMDLTDNQASMRMYHLDSPTVEYQKFLYENTNLGIELGVSSMVISCTSTGFVLTLSMTSGSDYKAISDDQIGAQLCFTPPDSETLASVKGVLSGTTEAGERVWTFNLPSSFDIDNNDQLYLDDFVMYGKTGATVATPLTNTFSFLFLMKTETSSKQSESDLKINTTLFTDPMVAIIETSFNVKFGAVLSNIYTRVRPITGDAIYQKYTYNVPDVYEENIFQYENKQLVLGEDGLPILLHKAGEPVMDYSDPANPVPAYKYLIGDYVKDANGEKVKVSDRELEYYFDFLGFDASYFFSTDSYDKAFAQTTKDYIVDPIMTDMLAFEARSMDKTKMKFLPKVKMGKIGVIINADIETTARSDLSFNITVYMTKNGFASTDLQSAIKSSFPTVINTELASSTVSNSSLLTALKSVAGDEVVDIKIESFAGDTSIDVISNEDEASGFSIRKVLENTNDTVLSVKEDITISFKQHKSS